MITATDGEQRSEEGTGKRVAGGEQAVGVTRAGGGVLAESGAKQRPAGQSGAEPRGNQSQGPGAGRGESL